MESQRAAEVGIESTDRQQLPATRIIVPNDLNEGRRESKADSPEKECAVAHRTGGMFEEGYRGDGR